MILYHGTTGKQARLILKEGFRSCETNWKDFPSIPGMAYLSDVYALYHCKQRTSGKAALIKVEVAEEHLYADEDFIGAVLKLDIKSPKKEWEQARAIVLRDRGLWEMSYKKMGVVCAPFAHVNVIGIQTFDLKSLWRIYDPIPSPMNHMFLADEYRELHEKIYNGVLIEQIVSQTIGKRRAKLKEIFGDDIPHSSETKGAT